MSFRVFAAVVPPPAVVEQLEDLVGPRRGADAALRWTLPEQWHLTTAFLERCEEGGVDRLLDRWGEVAARTPAFEMQLGGGGAVPEPFAARMLYLGVAQGADSFAGLSRKSRSAASAVGLRPDGATFLPHLTLARARRPIEATRWLRVVDSFGRFAMRAEELVVIRSHLGQGPQGRSRYQELARLPLGGPRES